MYFKQKLSLLDEHTLEVVRKSSASTIVKAAGMLIGLGVSIFLARTIGAEGLGIINLCNRIVNIIIVFGLWGFAQVIIKEIAIAYNDGDLEHISNVMYTAILMNSLLTIFLSISFILISPWLANNIFHESRLTFPLMIALVAMIPQVLSRVYASAVIGYRKIWQSNLVDQTLSITIVGVILIVMNLLNVTITINKVAIIYAIGRIIVTISIGYYWKKLFSYRFKAQFISKKLLKTALPLLFSSASFIVVSNLDLIIIGYYENSTQVGLYAVAARIALLTSFFLQITSSTISPKIAYLYKLNKKHELELMLQKSTAGLIVLGAVILMIFIILGKSILSIWGNEFTDAFFVLVILGFGQFINISTGAVAQILIMTGHEKTQARIAVIFMCINLILNLTLIKYLGIQGAAIATTITISGENITKLFFVKSKTDISTLPNLLK